MVQPLDIVDQYQQRRLLGERCKQAEGRGADDESVGRHRHPEAERSAERVRLWSRHAVQARQRRAQQLKQSGEWDVRLGLHSPSTEHGHVRCSFTGIRQQCTFANPGLTAQREHAAGADTRVGQELIYTGAFGSPTDQHDPVSGPRPAELIVGSQVRPPM